MTIVVPSLDIAAVVLFSEPLLRGFAEGFGEDGGDIFDVSLDGIVQVLRRWQVTFGFKVVFTSADVAAEVASVLQPNQLYADLNTASIPHASSATLILHIFSLTPLGTRSG